MRCFVALDLPAPVRTHLASVTHPLRQRFDIKWVPAEQMHLTLVFAGELDDDALGELANIVEDVELPPLSLRLQQLGHFPPRGLPRVVWAGLAGDTEPIVALHDELSARAKHLGIEREKRGFTPHITLGRVKSDFGALALVDELRGLGDSLKAKPWSPLGLVLYRSDLRPGGAFHHAIVQRPLPRAGAGGA